MNYVGEMVYRYNLNLRNKKDIAINSLPKFAEKLSERCYNLLKILSYLIN